MSDLPLSLSLLRAPSCSHSCISHLTLSIARAHAPSLLPSSLALPYSATSALCIGSGRTLLPHPRVLPPHCPFSRLVYLTAGIVVGMVRVLCVVVDIVGSGM